MTTLLDAIDVSRRAGTRQILQKLSLSIEPGELVANAGGSGAGKTTLLKILAGLQPPSGGEVSHNLADRRGIGYVPQDDIIHLEMPLRRTLRYAARLRLPAGTSADRVVEEIMKDLDLADRAEVPVRSLSGGQRKRASIAVELLTRPSLFFLDEPTSGLDPSTAADVMRLLRGLSERGVTVVLTTHEPAGIDRCDRVIFLARDGRLAFSGSPSQARRYFGVRDLADVYDRLAAGDPPMTWAPAIPARPARVPAATPHVKRPNVFRQWWLLTRRNVDVLVRNRLTLAVLLGSPVLVTAMMATLFRRGAFDAGGAADVGPAQIVFWIAFPGRVMSLGLSNRHAFQALGRDLHLDRFTDTLPAMSAYRDTFSGGTGGSLIALGSFAVALTLATVWVLDRRSAVTSAG